MSARLVVLGVAAGGIWIMTARKKVIEIAQNASARVASAVSPCFTPTPADFVARMEQAVRVARQKGAILNSPAVIAQAALETGWGKSIPWANGRCSHNIFGIKAGPSWGGPVVATKTKEWAGTRYVTVDAVWRAYPSWNECLVDYSRIVQRLYPGCLPHADAPLGDGDPEGWVSGLVSGPYRWATDPTYPQKLAAVGASLAHYGGPPWREV